MKPYRFVFHHRFVFHNQKEKMKSYRINVELNESFHIICEIVSLLTFDLSVFQNCTSKKGFFCTSGLSI